MALATVGGVDAEAAANERTVPLFLSTSDPDRQGFVRVINHSTEPGEVLIHAIDDAGNQRGPVTLSLSAGGNQHFNSDDLESGNAAKGLVGSIDTGEGDWRLHLETGLDIEVMAYVRTSDGFLTNIHDVVPAQGFCWRVPVFNPGSNTNQRSLLRLSNLKDREVSISIDGLDDNNASPGSTVTFQLPGQSARTVAASALENGEDGMIGALGDGHGKWQLAVTSDAPISVMNLLESPQGHLANLSRPALHSEGRCWAATNLTNADRSIEKYLTEPVQEDRSPGLIAAIIDSDGVRAISAHGVRKTGESTPLLITDQVHLGSMTKTMTSTMLATLVADGTFTAGWETTIADVFPELLDEIRTESHPVTLWQLVTLVGGVKRDAPNWGAHRHLDIIAQRYEILRENLADPAEVAVGEYHYSNLSYMIAGAMAEKVTGKSWESLMRERLFGPLGMSDAGFGPPGTLGELDQPWGHKRESVTSAWEPNQIDNWPSLGPAGRVHLTVIDWARFAALWLRGKPPLILNREDLDKLITPDKGMSYAAGWGVYEYSWAKGVALAHTGSNTSWYTAGWVVPNLGRVYFAGANAAEKDLDVSNDLLNEVITKLIDHDLSANGLGHDYQLDANNQ